jgi:hypothetical protein
MAFSYVVRAELDAALADRYVEWLVAGHVARVCEAGRASAVVVRIDGATSRVETRYVFESRDAFAAYERDHAPRLRAEGLEAFPSGVRFERTTGEIVHSRGGGA